MIEALNIHARGIVGQRLFGASLKSTSDEPLAPIKEYNFLNQTLPAGLTYTNSSTVRAWWDSTGTRRSAVANEPIFETLNGVAQGMRWEMEARTNLATNSEGAAATWTVSNVSDAGTPITGFAASLAFGNNSVVRQAYKTPALTLSTTYAVSIFVEMDDGNAPSVGANTTTGDFCIVSDGNFHTASANVQRIAANLYRVSSARTATVGGAARNCGIIKYTTQSARTFRVIGIQVETAASASSYIPTAGSAVTRQPDVLTASSISPWYNQSEWTVVFEGMLTDASATRGLYVFSDGTNSDRIFNNCTSSLSRLWAIDGGVTQVATTMSGCSNNTVFKIASAVKLNDFASSKDGESVSADAAATVPTINQLRLGSSTFDGSLSFMGYARRFSYYNTRLPNAIIQGLSRV